jgi:hypothetical protein
VLVAAAVVPATPLLVPGVGAGATPETDDLRSRCGQAVEALTAAAPDLLVVVGRDGGVRATSLAPWAPGCAAAATAVDIPEPVPLGPLVGAALTRGRRRSFVVVDPETSPPDCARLGAEVAGLADRVAVLAVGDGSACHHAKAPGYVDPRAPSYDDTVHACLSAADTVGLLALDVATAAELRVAGRVAWQVLAGAARPAGSWTATAHLEVPYGVGYHVATWIRSAD